MKITLTYDQPSGDHPVSVDFAENRIIDILLSIKFNRFSKTDSPILTQALNKFRLEKTTQ